MLSIVATAAVALAHAHATTGAVRPATVPMRAAVPTMFERSRPADTRAKRMPKGLPPKIADRVSFATSGIKTANQVEEVEILWKTFRQCYASEALAIDAATKNAAVLQPQLNSPTKIKGTYKLLCDRFGKKGAADVIQRNPGVLVCTPASMAKQSNEDILKAVELVEFLDANKGTIKAVSTALYLSFVALLAYGIAAKGNPEYGLPLIGQCILGEPGALYYGGCP
jgi:hypothetical protein